MNIFSDIRIILAEPKAGLRREYMEVLRDRGCRNIRETGNIKDVHDAFWEGQVDVLIGDNTLPEGELGELIRDVRHGRIGDNPFIIAMVLVGSHSPDKLKAIVDSGADDILVRPFEAQRIGERLQSFARGRKLFVVTSDYIGPDRRSATHGDGVQVPLIKVPNPLQLRVSGTSGTAYRRAVDIALRQVNEQKVERQAHSVQWLMERVVAVKNGELSGEDIAMEEQFERLNDIAIDITRRLDSTSYRHAMEMCLTLEKMTGLLRDSPDLASEDEMELMTKLIGVIHRKCNGNDPLGTQSVPAPEAPQDVAAAG